MSAVNPWSKSPEIHTTFLFCLFQIWYLGSLIFLYIYRVVLSEILLNWLPLSKLSLFKMAESNFRNIFPNRYKYTFFCPNICIQGQRI